MPERRWDKPEEPTNDAMVAMVTEAAAEATAATAAPPNSRGSSDELHKSVIVTNDDEQTKAKFECILL